MKQFCPAYSSNLKQNRKWFMSKNSCLPLSLKANISMGPSNLTKTMILSNSRIVYECNDINVAAQTILCVVLAVLKDNGFTTREHGTVNFEDEQNHTQVGFNNYLVLTNTFKPIKLGCRKHDIRTLVPVEVITIEDNGKRECKRRLTFKNMFQNDV